MIYHLIHTVIFNSNKRYEMFGDYDLAHKRIKKVVEYELDGQEWKVTNPDLDISDFVNAAKNPENYIFGGTSKTNELHNIINYLKSIQ